MGIPTTGRLFDIGCGEGRDLVFFASLGFKVVGLEGAPTAVARARLALASQGPADAVMEGDLAEIVWSGSFDLIVANQSLQFVGEAAWKVLQEIRAHTEPGGINAIGMFRRNPAVPEERGTLYLESGLLRRAYDGWRLLEESESMLWSPRREKYLSFTHLIAQRPSE